MAPNDALSSVNVEARLNEFEQKLDIVYRQFEQYFVGVEKRPPNQGRREIVRLLRELEQTAMIRTDLKFRYRALSQRFNSYKTYWSRTERQIEEGTYHRDVARARARQERRAARDAEAIETVDPPDDLGAAEIGESADSGENRGLGARQDDGAFHLGDLDFDDLDLSSLERELDQMDQRGEFEKYVPTQKIAQPPPFDRDDARAPNPRAAEPSAHPDIPTAPRQGRQGFAGVDTDLKKRRLAELQAKLGLSPRTLPATEPLDSGPAQFDRLDEGLTQKARPENPAAPARGADMSKLRKLHQAKQRIARERAENGQSEAHYPADPSSSVNRERRIIRRHHAAASAQSNPGLSDQRSSDIRFAEERTRKIYKDLLAAKQRCNEDTTRLSYDSFRHTIERQRSEIQQAKGVRDVDFKVVIKNGRAFIKPQTKE